MFAIGDCVDSGLPPTAHVASSQGIYLGRLFNDASELMFHAVLPHNRLMRRSLPDAATLPVAGDPQAVPQREIEDAFRDCDAFDHRSLGMRMSYLGDGKAVAQVGGATDADGKPLQSPVQTSGTKAYYLWRSVYFSTLLSARNRMLVAFSVLKDAVFGRDASSV